MDKSKLYKLIPYAAAFYFMDKFGYIYRVAEGNNASDKITNIDYGNLFGWPILSLNPWDLLWGLVGCACLFLYIWYKDSTRKKMRPGEEYGNARLGTAADIKPFINPRFRENCILSKTEFLTMEEKVKPWFMGRNKNAIFYGGSGAGKTFSMLLPNLLQFHSSYVVVDPKGTLLDSCGKLITKMGYKIKVFNTIDFDKSMGYNPFAYIKKETDIQKMVSTLMENTKEPDEKGQDPFWPKAEKLLYNAIIGYICEREVTDARNMITMLDLIAKIKVTDPVPVKKTRINDKGEEEEYTSMEAEKCAVDILFEEHEEENGETYSVRQYKKFLIGAGKTKRSILASVGARLSPFDIDTVREKMEFDELELDKIGDEKTVLFFIIDDSDTTFNFLVSMALSQMFNTLKTKADLSGGHLKYHVRVLWDETYNTGQVPKLEHLISQLRSRGISMWMFFQAKNQLIDLYGDKKAENPYAIATYLNALLHEPFTAGAVTGYEDTFFETQYHWYTTDEWVEREVPKYDEHGVYEGTEIINVHILHVHVTNQGEVKTAYALLDSQGDERFSVQLGVKGHKAYLWEGYNADDSEGMSRGSRNTYKVPANILSDDPAFASLYSLADSLIDTPYVWGGTTPDGFDCSGFVYYVYNTSGYASMPRLTAQELYNHCDPVSADEVKPGDLVFLSGTYASGNPVTHVCIYVGNYMVINCGSPVKYCNITTGWWRRHFYSYGRYRA